MTLEKRLNKAFRTIRACAAERGERSVGPALAENYRLIRKAYAETNARSAEKGGLYEPCARYLGRNAWKCGEKSFFEYFKNADLSFSALYSLHSALNAALIISIGEEAAAILSGGRCDEAKLSDSVVSLYKVGDIRLDRCFGELCGAEKYLTENVPLYSENDALSKDACRRAVIRRARRKSVTETEAATELCASPCGIYAAARGKTHKKAFFASLFASFALIMSVSFVAFGLYSLFALIPVFLLCGSLCDRVFSHIVPPFRPLRLDIRSSASSARTVAVYSTLLFGGEKDCAVFAELENAYLKNRQSDTVFGVLADFADSCEEESPEDAVIASHAVKRIRALNETYGEKFALFLRGRVYNSADGVWTGRERKRGAVCDLAAFLNGEDVRFAYSVNAERARHAKYLLTLDSDTSLPLGAVRELTSVALHPANVPVIQDGRVKSGHAVFQPRIKTGFLRKYATYFTLLRSEFGTLYESAAYERYQSLFGAGVFCGKGLIDISAFARLAKDAFPPNAVLSHDIPEGSVLRCMFVPDITFTDSSPKTPVSAFARLHRWIRGDVQNLSLLGLRAVPPLGKYVMSENVLRHLAPVFAVCGVTVCAFTPGQSPYKAAVFIMLLVSDLLSPAAFSLCGVLLGRAFTPRRFFSVALTSAKWISVNLVYELSALYENAFCAADAALRSAWRMAFSHKKMLEWTTFDQTDSRSAHVLNHISAFFAPSALGAVTAVLSPYPVARAMGSLAFLLPLFSFIVSKEIPSSENSVSQKQKEKFALFAREQYAFFADRVTEKTNFLPPDNVQFSPAETVAERTSPTNIGLYLLCAAAAADFGFITREQAENAVENTLSTVEKLRKYRGHLYNWYDTRSLAVIGESYVSTVDSGNFVTMLVTLAGALRSFGTQKAEKLAQRAEKLASDTDFSFLYDTARELFRLGYSERDGLSAGYYDMLMSEIRTTCYYACASGIAPKAHWTSLSRAVTEKHGYVGMISWSGSAFEYFMPQLFLPSYPNSFLDETLSFAVYCQRLRRKNKLWGISESGFYAFDTDMNYQYKAHGVPALALKKYPPDEFVVSPYSAFLMAERAPEQTLRLLEAYEKAGMRGEYGFYEAYDFSSNGGIVRSYMSHHVGMSMLACANICFDGIMRRRFFADRRMFACRELLCESVPADVECVKVRSVSPRREKARGRYPASPGVSPDLARPSCALYRGGNISMAASSDGRIALRSGAYALDNCSFSAFSRRHGVTFGVLCGGMPHVCLPRANGFTARFDDSSFAFVSSDPRCPVTVKGAALKEKGAFVFDLRTDPLAAQSACLDFTPVIDKPSAYAAHPAFSRLFIESSFLQNEKIIVFRRRTEPGGGRYPLCGVALGDKKAKFCFRTSDSALRSHSRGQNGGAFTLPCDNSTGVCIEPDCTVITPVPPSGKTRFIIACGYTVREVAAAVERARAFTMPKKSANSLSKAASDAISAAMFAHNSGKTASCNTSALWKAGVSGDEPLLTLELYGKNENAVKALFAAFKALNSAFYRCETLFIVHEPRGYSMPLTEWLKEKICENGLERYSGRRNGVFIANASLFSADELGFVRAFSAYSAESDSGLSRPPRVTEDRISVRRSECESRFCEKILPPAVFVSGTPPLPRSYIMAGYALGTLVTEKTLGFTFYGSARDRRITAFDQDPHSPVYGEELLMARGGNVYDLVSLSDSAEYRDGIARYTGTVCGVGYAVRVCVHPKLPVKIISAEFDQPDVKTVFRAFPEGRDNSVYPLKEQNAVCFRSLKSERGGSVCFVSAPQKCELFTDPDAALGGADLQLYDSACVSSAGTHAVYYLGACPDDTAVKNVLDAISAFPADELFKTAADFARSFIPPQTAFTSDGALDALYSPFAPYQAAFSRFLGRTGFYQTGGAYGFRDQLQDCLCLVYSRPDLVRAHIIRCASHQYMRGDVMHWWLKNSFYTGTRTACSDDMLYLPVAAGDYCEKTGDYSLLSVKAPYLKSPPVEKGERFETAARAEETESVHLHCLRALLYASGRTGAHGLSLMGSCDWNDGFSAAGREGKGESVFTTLLLAYAAGEYCRVCRKTGDIKSAETLEEIKKRAQNAVNACFKGDRFPRGTYDSGEFFGVKGCGECEIDVICQGLAAVVSGRNERTLSGLNAALKVLFDTQKNVLKLFAPPFDAVDAGYISAYPAGVRENGGQYTHGALWGIWGLCACGEYEKAYELIKAITPAGHTDPEEYKLEPYVIPADIYSTGRGGWSWYTGSAAWFYKIMTEQIMGIRFEDGFSKVTVVPGCEYTFICERNGYKLKILSSRTQKTPELDGVKTAFPLVIPKGEHVLRVKAPY